MRNKWIFSIAALIFFTIFLSIGKVVAEDPNIPSPVGDIYIQDFAGILTQQEKVEIIRMGRRIEDLTSAQIAVLTVDTIGDVTIEEFANEAFRQYGIGAANEDNGVLLVVGMNPSPGMDKRPLRIEVGYGLEGALPDGKVGRILDAVTLPYLLNQQPDLAITETYKVLANEVLAEYGVMIDQQQTQLPNQQYSASTSGDGGLGIPPWLFIIILVIVVYLDFKFFGGFLTHILLSIISRGGRGGGGGFRGGGGGSSGGGGASRGW